MLHNINKILKGKGRTALILKNVGASTLLKAISITLSFIMVPITLDYLSKTGYGLWSALSSILTWFFIFDIGIGNGLKNKFIELKAQNKFKEIKYYVSTAYAIFVSLIFVVIVIFYFINEFINWGELLNAPISMHNEVDKTIIIVFVALCLNFVLRLINTILQADLRTGLSDSFGVIYSSITLIGILVIREIATPSLSNFALLYTGSTLLVTITASLVLFSTDYKEIRPRIKFVQIKFAKDLSTIGFKFFFLQLGSLILFQTSGLILSSLVGPDSVADYNISLKYFSVAAILFSILAQPLWTGFGDAYYQKDILWIKKTFKRLNKLVLFLTALLIILLISQKFIFNLWLGDRIEVNYFMSILFLVFYIFQMISGTYEPFINSTGKLKLSLRVLMCSVPLFIPITYLLITYFNLEASGMLIGLILFTSIPSSVFSIIQSKKILAGAKGIWNK